MGTSPSQRFQLELERLFAMGEAERRLRRARAEYDKERLRDDQSFGSVFRAQASWWQAKMVLDQMCESQQRVNALDIELG